MELLQHFIHAYGLLAVAAVVGLECIGFPLPGVTALLAAAIFAGTNHDLNIVSVIITAAAAAIVGRMVGYVIGREYGYWLLLRYGNYVRMSPSRIKLGQYLFLRHGGKIVFVRFPNSGGLKELEDKLMPRQQNWDPLLQMTGAPGIYYSDFPELSGFNCPEWSHLSAGDSVEFTKRLVPHLQVALGM